MPEDEELQNWLDNQEPDEAHVAAMRKLQKALRPPRPFAEALAEFRRERELQAYAKAIGA